MVNEASLKAIVSTLLPASGIRFRLVIVFGLQQATAAAEQRNRPRKSSCAKKTMT
jgi:hypothetical protein